MKDYLQNTNIRWGIIGCGAVTEVKSGPAFQKIDGFALEAVMRRDAAKCADYAQRHAVPKYYTNADDLIADPDIDAIYIATPPDSHKLYALKVAQAGKIVCVEKPLAPSFEDSLEIVNAFQEKNIPLFVAYYRRSLDRFIQIKEWIEEGKIGAVRNISWTLTKPVSEIDMSQSYNWRTDAKLARGGYFDDLASHGLDLFAYLLGNFKWVSGATQNQKKIYSASDAVVACWIHESGCTGTGTWNFVAQKRLDEVILLGEKGTITFSVFDENPIVLNSDLENISKTIAHPENVQLQHVHNMQKHLSGHMEHPSTGASALHTSWVMEQILAHKEY